MSEKQCFQWLPKSVLSLISELVWNRIPDGWSSDRGFKGHQLHPSALPVSSNTIASVVLCPLLYRRCWWHMSVCNALWRVLLCTRSTTPCLARTTGKVSVCYCSPWSSMIRTRSATSAWDSNPSSTSPVRVQFISVSLYLRWVKIALSWKQSGNCYIAEARQWSHWKLPAAQVHYDDMRGKSKMEHT